jgi:DNA-binding response OmpR family regulator
MSAGRDARQGGTAVTQPARVLIVDDEANIRASIEEMLLRDGHQAVAVESGEAALALMETQEFDLALIDLRMKGIGGIEVLTALRQRSPDTVTIVLTAHASLGTAVEALRLGAHDYLFKPCNPEELRESIRRGLLNRQEEQQRDLLRQLERMAGDLEDIRTSLVDQIHRPSPSVAQPTDGQKRFLQKGNLIVDSLRHVITLDGHLLDLSPTEFDMMAYLIRRAPRVVSPQELVREVQGYESPQWEASETVRQHIYRIRQKVKEATGRKNVIQTVRGVGYTITE